MNPPEQYQKEKETPRALSSDENRIRSKSISIIAPHRQIFVGKVGNDVCLHVLRPTLIVSLDSNLIVKNKATEKCYFTSSILITSGSEICLDARDDKVLFIVLDDRGNDLYALMRRKKKIIFGFGKSEILCDFEDTPALKRWAQLNLQSEHVSPMTASKWFDAWFDADAIYASIADHRVVETIYEIKRNAQQNLPVDDIAGKVFLSPTRLTELFKQTTGSSIRSFRLWQRICTTIELFAGGYKPETAALDAGFADYAQFSRKFKEMFGASPCRLHSNLNENRILWVPHQPTSEQRLRFSSAL